MINQVRLNAYQIMWLFVFFDLPTETKTERKKANRFRKDLLNDGFCMMQFSVYIRHCASRESADVHINRVASFVPDTGHVSVLIITDKQYGGIINFWGTKAKSTIKEQKLPQQLELF